MPVCIPRRIPHGATHATGMPFRLWAIMSILSQAFRVGPKHILQIKIIFSVAHVRVCVIVRVCDCACVCVLNTSFWMNNQVTGLFVDSFFWVAYCDGQAFVHTPGKYYLVDCFAGKARLSKAWAEAGMSACTLDLSRGEDDVP